jgi:hypothetical protein
MNKKLLLSTAALLAGMSLASAQQHMPGGQTSGQSAQTQSSQAQHGDQEQSRQGQAKRSEGRGQRDLTTGQGSQSSQAQQGSQGQRAQGAQSGREQTTGQGMSQHNAQSQSGNQRRQLGQSGRERQNSETLGQAPHNQQGQSLQPQHSQPQQGQAQQSQPQPGQLQQGKAHPQQSPGVTTGQSERIGSQQSQDTAGVVTLTNEQRMRIRETVLARSDAPRVDVNRVDFALVAGTIVPTYVRVVEVPDTLITIHPEWRGEMYFVTGDEVIIVDHSRRIVATLLGSDTRSSAMVNERGSSTDMHLSRDEIRQVQIMLNQQGFNVGEPDGILGARTREALIAFQRNKGFQASGQIDQRTLAALGVSGASHQGNQSQPATMGPTGQSGTGMHQPNAREGASSTTGQGNPPAQHPAAPNAAGSSSMPQRQPR